VIHAYNLSYPRGRDQESHSLRHVRAKVIKTTFQQTSYVWWYIVIPAMWGVQVGE
jgi:hypothetical protein